MSFFDKFPLTTYANTLCIDITKRVRVLDSVRNNPYIYYPYTVKDGTRADTIAHKYYEDQMASWLVFLSMDVVDPYHEYPLSTDQFQDFIVDKYGSIANAQARIAYWELNWADDDTELTPGGFASLPDALKKYYDAIYGIGANIIGYNRRQDDWLTTTNMIVTFNFANTIPSNGVFQTGEQIQVFEANVWTGNSEVVWSNSSVVVVQHVQGDTPASNAKLVGLSSNVSANVTNRAYTSNCIAIDERVYWEPVTFWDHELSKNQLRRHIRLIDSKFKGQAETDLQNLMNNASPDSIL